MRIPPSGHDSVLLEQVLLWLAPRAGQTVVDCTIGRAGHASAIANQLGPGGLLIGLDVDPLNLKFAQHQLDAIPCHIRLFQANFSELRDVLGECDISSVDGILADLGVSTNQLFEETYGLSFSAPMSLDMRLDPRLERSAADLVNHLPEGALADILFTLAQERYSRRIARKIVEARQISPITTTQRLAELVRQSVPHRGGAPERIDPATRTFLALRMHVNQEMKSLQSLMGDGAKILRPGGRMAVISFQSMEDRVVKQAFRVGGAGRADASPHQEAPSPRPMPRSSATPEAGRPSSEWPRSYERRDAVALARIG